MTAVLEIEPLVVPLRTDETDVVRVGKTRVTLDVFVAALDRGDTAEDIVDQYPTLELADVHAATAYVMRHREQVDAYLKEREERAERLRERIESRPEYQAMQTQMAERGKAWLNRRRSI